MCKRKVIGTDIEAKVQWTDEETPQLKSITLIKDGKIVILSDEVFPVMSFFKSVMEDDAVQKLTKMRRSKK